MQKPSVAVVIAVFLLLVASGCSTTRIYLENSPLRITELHFDPYETQGAVEFVEIANLSAKAIDVSGWVVSGVGDPVLPDGTLILPGKTVVLCEDADAFKAAFGSAVTPAAVYTGKLKGSGETVRVEDAQGRVADEVSYDEDDSEVQKASDTGLSIHRIRGAGGQAATWKAAAPTPGTWNP